jgi:aspartate dehydrogenase
MGHSIAPLRVGLAGFGSVGSAVARKIDDGAIPRLVLSAITSRDLDKAAQNAASLQSKPRVVSLPEIADLVDVVVECATADAFPAIARTVLSAGKTLIALSAAGVPAVPDLLQFALEHGGRLRIASGALPGIDSVRCAAEGNIRSVKLSSRIVPSTFIGEPYLIERGFDFTKPITGPVHVFSGSAREAAAAFPRHFNVAITLSLAGIGFDRTQVEIHADPGIHGAVHQVEVDAEEAQFTLTSRNRPSVANPKTSRIISLSVVAALRSLEAPIQVGS